MGYKRNYGVYNQDTWQEEWVNEGHKGVIGVVGDEWQFWMDGEPVVKIDPTGIILGGGDSLPDQDTHAGEYLTTDGSSTSWSAISTDIDDILPDQTGQSGSYLTTDGSNASWAAVAGSGVGDVSKVDTPIDDQVGVWTGEYTIEGTSGLTYDGTDLTITGNLSVTGSVANSATVNINPTNIYDTTSTQEPLIVQVYDSTGIQLSVPAQVKVQVELDTTYKINLTSYIGDLSNVKVTWLC